MDEYKNGPHQELNSEKFRELGHMIIDQLADFLEELPEMKVTPGEKPSEVIRSLGNGSLPNDGNRAEETLLALINSLKTHSLFNGHPRFMGYITSSALPIGVLGDLIASAFNPNVGAWKLSPMATEIEKQTLKWIAEFMGYPDTSAGILVSGGNMANMIGFWVARNMKGPEDLRKKGASEQKMMAYASVETHTWIQKAADLSGIGTDSIRWVAVNKNREMDLDDLNKKIREDQEKGYKPFMVVGTAGSVGLGVVDPLFEIAEICKTEDLWFHIDGAYGAPAAQLAESPTSLKALKFGDSIAVDPHKWLYSPLEAGCILVRDPKALISTFNYAASYYEFEIEDTEAPINFFEWGPQNSRGFRALKIWLSFMYLGRNGMEKLIQKDILLARYLFEKAEQTPGITPYKNALSITTFFYIPEDLDENDDIEYLNELNKGNT